MCQLNLHLNSQLSSQTEASSFQILQRKLESCDTIVWFSKPCLGHQQTVLVTPTRITKTKPWTFHSTSDITVITLGLGWDLLSSLRISSVPAIKLKSISISSFALCISMANANISIWLDDWFVNYFPALCCTQIARQAITLSRPDVHTHSNIWAKTS